MNLLVIGGSGYLGREVIKEASRRNWKIISVSLKRRKIKTKKNSNVNYFFKDITKKEQIIFLKKYKFDYVVNTSGYVDHSNFFKNGRSIIDNHLVSLINIISVLNRKNLKGFVQIGSSEEYGIDNKIQNEGDREAPASPYAFSKMASSHFLQMLSKSESFPATTLRVFLVYGPGQDKNRLIPYVIDKCFKDKKFKISHGKQKRDFTYIDDLVKAIFLCLKAKKANGKIYNIGTGKTTSVKSVVKLIHSSIGKGSPSFGEKKIIRNENLNLVARINSIKKDLKWTSSTKLVEGINKTIKMYNEQ
tara:strand:+ start:3958 stop:4866 length:909 start_codon:yes stop_codon:yes gene_type:complete